MTSHASSKLDGWGTGTRRIERSLSAADVLLRVVDGGLCGVIFVAPYFFGGRHDMGRLLLVAIVAVTACAWFARQSTLPNARWPRTIANLVLLLAAALVLIQIIPLPQDLVARLSLRNSQLLPLWTGGGEGTVDFGKWRTLSLMPHETTKSLEGTSTGPIGTAHNLAVYIPEPHPWFQGGPFLNHDYPGFSLRMLDEHILRVRVRFEKSDRVQWEVNVAEFLDRR